MQQGTIGTKNQIVIPKEIRKQISALKPGAKVSIYSRGNDEVIIKADNGNWVERTRGIAKNAWKRKDPIKELEKMRNEW